MKCAPTAAAWGCRRRIPKNREQGVGNTVDGRLLAVDAQNAGGKLSFAGEIPMKPCIRVASFAVVLVVFCWAAFGQVSDMKGIWKATPLSYPTVARLAQLQGDLKLKLVIDKAGRITSVSKIEGPDALAVTAAREIQHWRYASNRRDWQGTLVIHYSLHGPPVPAAPVARFEIETPLSVNVSSNYPLPTGNPERVLPK